MRRMSCLTPFLQTDLLAVAETLKEKGSMAEIVITHANEAVMEGEVAFTTVTALKESRKVFLYEANMQDCKAAKGNMRKAHKYLAGHVKRAQGLLSNIEAWADVASVED